MVTSFYFILYSKVYFVGDAIPSFVLQAIQGAAELPYMHVFRTRTVASAAGRRMNIHAWLANIRSIAIACSLLTIGGTVVYTYSSSISPFYKVLGTAY